MSEHKNCPKCGAKLTYLTNMDDGSTIIAFACGSVLTTNMHGGYGDSLSQHADCVTAQIATLTTENATLAGIVRAARNLLLAATGPEGGPESWLDTRSRWLGLVEEWVAKNPAEQEGGA